MMHYFNRMTFILALATAFPATTTHAASDTATLTLSATVTAVCTLEAPAAVSLSDIPITAFSGQSTGQYLYDYAQSFTITTSCSGSDDYTLTFTAATVANTCVGANNTAYSAVRFCIKTPEDTALNFSSGTATYSGSEASDSLTFTVYPQVGNNSASVGQFSASVILTISPA